LITRRRLEADLKGGQRGSRMSCSRSVTAVYPPNIRPREAPAKACG
jgi:hypothetical protein